MLLSFIVPFYNVEEYIEQCVRSLCEQDIPNGMYEVICVDDCSPDKSARIIKELQKEYSQIRLIKHDRNKKLGGARNTGLQIAKGDYIWFVDSDDYVRTNVLGNISKILMSEKVDFLHFNYSELRNGIIRDIQENNDIEIITGIDLFLHPTFNWSRDHIVAWTKIYNRQFLIDNSLFFAEDVMYEDNDYAILCYFLAERVKHISQSFYVYRCNPNSITRVKYTDVHILYWLKLCNRLITVYNRINRKNTNYKYCVEIHTFIRNMIYQIISAYKMLDECSKSKAKQHIRHEFNKTYRPYMSCKNYWKFKIGII